MLAQSLFALAIPVASQAGDASAAPADGEFGRLVDVATRAAEPQAEAGPDKPTAAPTNWTGPQILPGTDPQPKVKSDAHPRPEVLPGEPGPKTGDQTAPDPEVLPGPSADPASPTTAVLTKAAPTEDDPSPEILPTSVGPDESPRPEILPVTFGPGATPLEKAAPAQTVAPDAQTAPSPAQSTTTTADAMPSLSDALERPTASSADAEVAPSTTSETATSIARPASESANVPMPERTAPVGAKTPTAQTTEPARFDPPPATASADTAIAPSVDPGTPTTQTSMVGLSRVAHETLADLTAQIVKRLEGKVTRFEMALTPEDLGRVDVSLEMGEDGSLTARLAFDTPAAAAEMRAQVDQLRRQLEQAGFQLARDALDFSHRDGSSPQQDRFERRQNRAFAAARDLADRVEAAPLMNLSLSLGSARDRVDVKV